MKASTLVGAAVIGILVLSSRGAAQLAGTMNPAAWFPVPDPAALGVHSRLALEGYVTTRENLVLVHFRVGDGALRLLGGGASRRLSLGGGYARQLLDRDLGAFGTFTVGGEATVASSALKSFVDGAAMAGRLTVPLGWRWGREKGWTVTPYVVPYTEIGRTPGVARTPADCGLILDAGCTFRRDGWRGTHAMGAGLGLKLSYAQVDLHFAIRDVVPLRYSENGIWWAVDRVGLGLTVRMPR